MASATTTEQASNLADPNTATMPKKAIGLRLAQKAMMMNDTQQILAESRAKHRSWWRNKGVAGMSGEGAVDVPPEEDDVGIHVGDITINNPPPPQQLQDTKPAAASPQPASTGLSKLAQAAIIGSSLVGGTGIGAGAMALLNKPAAEISQPAQQQPTTNPGVQLRIYQPPEETANGGSGNSN